MTWLLLSLRIAGPLVIWVIQLVKEIDEYQWAKQHPGQPMPDNRRWTNSPKDAARRIVDYAAARRKRKDDEEILRGALP